MEITKAVYLRVFAEGYREALKNVERRILAKSLSANHHARQEVRRLISAEDWQIPTQ